MSLGQWLLLPAIFCQSLSAKITSPTAGCSLVKNTWVLARKKISILTNLLKASLNLNISFKLYSWHSVIWFSLIKWEVTVIEGALLGTLTMQKHWNSFPWFLCERCVSVGYVTVRYKLYAESSLHSLRPSSLYALYTVRYHPPVMLLWVHSRSYFMLRWCNSYLCLTQPPRAHLVFYRCRIPPADTHWSGTVQRLPCGFWCVGGYSWVRE